MSDREDFSLRGIGQVMMYGAPPLDQPPGVIPTFVPVITSGQFQGGAVLPPLGIVDPELVAVHAVLEAIRALGIDAQERVLEYVTRRVRAEAKR